MGELAIILSTIVATLRIVFMMPQIMKQFSESNFRFELENIKADITFKRRGHIMPVLIERLDDGTNPTQQHLSLDLALVFPQERIDRALYYRNGLTAYRVFQVLGYEIGKQAAVGAEPGEERTISAVIDVFDGAITYTYVLRGHVGQGYQLVSLKRDKNIFRFLKQVPKRAKQQMELKEAQEAKRKQKEPIV
jgi:hypothetical protein